MRELLDDPRARAVATIAGPAIVILAVQAVLFPMPPGVYSIGIVFGMLAALGALGMALIYRANRILNFAQGDLGLAPTVFAIDLIAYSSFPYPIALLVGLLAAVLLGVIVEFGIVRRFFRAPRLILTVATIGLAQLLTVGALLIPMIWGKEPVSQNIVAPFDFTFEIRPVTFHANELIAVILAPAVIALVAMFLRYTNVGIAVRAAAERADRASLLGVPVKRLQTVVWCMAALLSFIAVFLKAGIVGLPYVSTGGFGTTSFGTLLVALAALTLGRLTNLPAVAVSAVSLGVLEQAVIWNNNNNPAFIYPVIGGVILVGLIGVRGWLLAVPFLAYEVPRWFEAGQPVRASAAIVLCLVAIGAQFLVGRGAGSWLAKSRAEQDTTTSWQAADEIRPIPRELKSVPEVAALKWGGLALLAFLAYRLPLFEFMDSGRLIKATAVVIFAIVGISIIMLTGWAGQVSIGQMAFVGAGGAVGAYVTEKMDLDLSIALVAAGVVGALVAVVVGLPALRVRGLFLAVTTLAFAITASAYLLNPSYASWIPQSRIVRAPLFGRIQLESAGTVGGVSGEAPIYWLSLACLALTILAVSGLRRSRTGRALLALRENERGAQAYGINVTRAKLTAFALSGFFAAVAGCLFVQLTHTFQASEFGAGPSFAVFTSTVVGGLGSMTGAVIGALFSRGGTWFLQGYWQLLPSAIGVLLILLIYPGGLGGLFFKLRDLWLRSVARRNAIIVPSLLADVRVDDTTVLEHAEEAAEHAHLGEQGAGAEDLVGAGTAGEPTEPTEPTEPAMTPGGPS